jgi:hypothetical protein
MSAVHQSTDPAEHTQTASDAPVDAAVIDPARDPGIALDLRLDEAEALRAWLLKPAADGTTSLDDPLVSRVLARVGAAVDAARATVSIRQELLQAGVSVDHLSDEEIRALARRIADAGSAAIRS